MSFPLGIVMNKLYEKANSLSSEGKIDSIDNLKNHKTYIYAGTKDTVVNPTAGKKAAEWYKNFGSDVKTNFDTPS